jgi:lactoylglutathione lyase
MKLGYSILYVNDVSQALAFYERAFGLKRRFVDEKGQYGELDTGATALAFVSNDAAGKHLPEGFRRNSRQELPGGFEIAFLSEDVQGAFDQAVKNGAVAVTKPAQKPWGQTVAYVRDLDGVLVELASPMK